MSTRSRAGGRPKRDLVGGERTSAIVAGDNRRVRIKDALVSAGSRRSIISPKLVERVGAEIGPKSCTIAQTVGDVCGPTAEVQVCAFHVMARSCSRASRAAVPADLAQAFQTITRSRSAIARSHSG